MAQLNFNRELANLRVNLTNIDISEGYATLGKLKGNSLVHGAEENNLLPSQTINNDQSEEALAGAAAMLSLLPLQTKLTLRWLQRPSSG